MLVHVINLDRSGDRLSEFMAVNGHLKELSRFPAIDGGALDVPELVRAGTIREEILVQDPAIPKDIHAKYTKGALGNALSHIALWGKAIASARPLTICEDDVVFHSQYGAMAETMLGALPSDWDIIFWSWNTNSPILFEAIPGVHWCVAYFDGANTRETAGIFQRQPLSPMPFRLREVLGMGCYSISPKGAQALTDFCLPLRRMSPYSVGLKGYVANAGIDIMALAAYRTLKAFVSFPPLAIIINDMSRSTVQETTA